MAGLLEGGPVTGIERAWALASRSDTEIVVDADGHVTLRGVTDWMWLRRDVWAEVQNLQPERKDDA